MSLKGQVRNEHLTRKDIEKLLTGMSKLDITFKKKSYGIGEMGEEIYATPEGKKILDTLVENKVGIKVLRKHGFVAAELGIGLFLDRLIKKTASK